MILNWIYVSRFDMLLFVLVEEEQKEKRSSWSKKPYTFIKFIYNCFLLTSFDWFAYMFKKFEILEVFTK